MQIKRILLVGLVCCLLAACTPEPGDPTAATAAVPTTQETVQAAAQETTRAATEPSTEAPTTQPVTEETLPPTEPSVAVTEPEDGDLVRVTDYIPGIAVELKYATEDNFTGKQIYEFTDAYLRYGTVKKLAAVQADLQEQGYGLKIWDGFRPVAAQFTLWEVYPDSRFVANPNVGYSNHCRGNTVDVTLIDLDTGEELEMPTAFDEFSSLADRNYSDCTAEAAENARLMENLMQAWGFSPYWSEWWHFTDTDTYPVEKDFIPKQ